jgi:hypothetical protein
MNRPIAPDSIAKDLIFGVVAIGIVFLAAWSAELFL